MVEKACTITQAVELELHLLTLSEEQPACEAQGCVLVSSETSIMGKYGPAAIGRCYMAVVSKGCVVDFENCIEQSKWCALIFKRGRGLLNSPKI